MINSIALLRESAAERGEDWSGLKAAERKMRAREDGEDAALAWFVNRIDWIGVAALAPAEGQPEREEFFKAFSEQYAAMMGEVR